MADVIHRTTLQFLPSANTPLYPEPEWKHNPDMTQVVGVARRFWKWDAGTERPIPQTAGEQAATIAAALDAQRDAALAAQVDNVEDVLRQVVVLFVAEFNAHTDRTNAILDAIDGASNLSGLKTAIGAITDLPTRTLAQLRTIIRAGMGT